MFQPKKGYPKLRGRASDIAGLAHCMFDLWSHCMDQGDQHHLRIRLFLKLNLELKDILETFSPTYGHTALPEPQYTKAFQGGLSMAQLHKQLNEHFEATDVIFLMSQAKLISHGTVCNFPTVYTLSWYGVTKESPLCVVHRSFGSLACMAANTGRLQWKLLGRSAI